MSKKNKQIEKRRGRRFTKRDGCEDLGHEYELRMTVFLCFECLKQEKDFEIYSNGAHVGDFDDLVLILTEKVTLYQLKWKKNGDISLHLIQKLFDSYKKLETTFSVEGKDEKLKTYSFEDCHLVVYTNNKLAGFKELKVNKLPTEEHVPGYFPNMKESEKFKLEKVEEVGNDNKNLFNELEKKGDSKDILNYFKKLVICLKQPGPEHLWTVTELHLKQNYPDIDTTLMLHDIDTWVGNEMSSGYTIIQTIFKEKLDEIILRRLHLKYAEPYSWKFKSDCIKGMLSYLQGKGVVNLYGLQGYRLLQSKMKYLVENHFSAKFNLNKGLLYLPGSQAKKYKEALENFLGTRQTFCVVLYDIDDEDIDDFLSLIRHNSLRLVLLTEHQITRKINNTLIETSLQDFEEDNISAILQTTVIFQGSPLVIKDIVGDTNEVKRLLKQGILEELLYDKKMILGKPLPGLNCKYHNRSIDQKRYYIDNVELFEDKDRAFIITKGNVYEALIAAAQQPCTELETDDVTAKQYGNVFFVSSFSCGFFMEKTKHFQSVHWFEEDNNMLWWKRTHGQQIKMKWIPVHAKEQDISGSFGVLEGEPGSGKTTSFLYLAHQRKLQDRNNLVLFVDLKKYYDFFYKNDFENQGCMLNFLTLTFCSASRQTIVELCLQKMGASVYLDGLDEMSTKYVPKVMKFLNLFLDEAKGNHVYISTRTSLEFCKTFPSFTLSDMLIEDQKRVLLDIWTQLEPACSTDIIKRFINKLLIALSRNIGEKLAGKILRVPLHISMIATIFTKDLQLFNSTGTIHLPKRFNVLALYEEFILSKCRDYMKKKIKMSDPSFEFQVEVHLNQIKVHYQYCALHAIVDTEALSLGHVDITTSLQHVRDGFDGYGIISHILEDDIPYFVHRSFAEYFVALWFFNNYQHHSSFIENNFTTPQFQMIRFFLDFMLTEEKPLFLHIISGGSYQSAPLELPDLFQQDKAKRNLLHMAVLYRNTSYLKPMLENHQDAGILSLLHAKDGFLNWTPDKYAAWGVPNWLILGLLYEYNVTPDKQLLQSVWPDRRQLATLLTTCCEYDYLTLFNTIMELDPTIVLGMPLTDSKLTILDMAASLGCIAITELLSSRYKSVLNLSAALHHAVSRNQLQVVAILLNQGANIYSIYNNMSIMHVALHIGSADMVRLLIDKGGSSLINLSTDTMAPPLFYCIDQKLNSSCAVELIRHGAELDSWGNETAILLAIRNKQTQVLNAIREYVVYSKKTRTLLLPLLVHDMDDNGAFTKKEFDYMREKCHNIRSLLYYAVMFDKTDLVQYLLDNDLVNKNILNSNVEVALLMAAKKSNRTLVQRLLELGSNPNVSEHGWTPLHWAAFHGDVAMAETLFQHDAAVTFGSEITPLRVAIQQSHADVAQLLINKGTKWNILRDGTTDLHCIVSSRLDLQIPLDGKMKVDIPDLCYRNTPLMDAVRLGRDHYFNLLLPLADLYVTNTARETIFSLAVQHKRVEFTGKIIDRDPQIVWNTTAPLLCHAICNDDLHTVTTLVNHRSPLNRTLNSLTPLMYAVKQRNVNIIRYLLEQHGCDVNQQDKDGNSALHYAVKVDDIETYIMLAQKGATWLPNNNDETPFFLSAKLNNSVFDILLESEEVTKDILQDAAFFAISSKQSSALEKLIAKNIDINCVIKGRTLLTWAARHNNINMFRLLLDLDADCSQKDENGFSVWDVASIEMLGLLTQKTRQAAQNHFHPLTLIALVKQKKAGAIDYFPSSCPDLVNQADNNGWTSIHHAIFINNSFILSKLINKGGNINCVTNKNETPLILACKYGYHQLAGYLLQQPDIDISTTDTTSPQNDRNALYYALHNNMIHIENKLKEMGGVLPKHSLEIAIINKNNEVIERIIRQEGKSINAVRVEGGNSFLHLSAAHNNMFSLTKLIENGADVNCENDRRQTPLITAARRGNYTLEMYETLLAAGAVVSIRDKCKKTVFDYLPKKKNQKKEEIEDILRKAETQEMRDSKKCLKQILKTKSYHNKKGTKS